MEGIMDITAIIQYGSLALLGIFLFYILGSILFGLFRGWKRQLLRLGLVALSLVIALVIAPATYSWSLDANLTPVAKMFNIDDLGNEMLNEKLENGEKISVNIIVSDILEEVLRGEQAGGGEEGGLVIGGGAEADTDAMTALLDEVLPPLIKVFINIPSMIVNLFLFVIIFGIMRLITWGIFAILKWLLFRADRERRKEHKRFPDATKPKQGRLIGGGIGIVQGFIIALAVMVPFAAIAGTVETFANEVETARLEAVLEMDGGSEFSATDILKLHEAYTKSFPGTIYKGMGLDRMLYKPLTTVKVGKLSFTMNDFAKLGATAVNVLSSDFNALREALDKAEDEAQYKAAMNKLLDFIDEAVAGFLDNNIIVSIVGQVAEVLTKPENMDMLVKALVEDFFTPNTSEPDPGMMMLAAGEEEEDNTAAKEALSSFVRQLLADMAGANSTTDNFCVNLEEFLLSVTGIVRTLNNEGILFDIMGKGADNFDLDNMMENGMLADERLVGLLGQAMDDLLATKMLKNSTKFLFDFVMAEYAGDLAEALPGSVDISVLHLENVLWKEAALTVVKVFGFVSEYIGDMEEEGGFNFGGTGAGDKAVEIIFGLGKSSKPGTDAGLLKMFEGVIKSLLIDMEELKTVDEEFFETGGKDGKPIDLDLYNNREKVGALIDIIFDWASLKEALDNLVALGVGDDLESAAANRETVENLVENLKKIQGTGDSGFNTLIDRIMTEFIGDGATIDNMLKALEVVDKLLEAQEKLEDKLGGLEEKIEEKLDEKLDEWLDGKLDERLEEKVEEKIKDIPDIDDLTPEELERKKDELREELRDEVIEELKDELREELRDELMEELLDELNDELLALAEELLDLILGEEGDESGLLDLIEGLLPEEGIELPEDYRDVVEETLQGLLDDGKITQAQYDKIVALFTLFSAKHGG